MADTGIIFAQKRYINQIEKENHRLRQIIIASQQMLEETASFACAYVFDLARGDPPMTQDEMRNILDERYPSEVDK